MIIDVRLDDHDNLLKEAICNLMMGF